MRAPPPVEYTNGSSRAWRGALSAVVAAAVAVPVAWALPWVADAWAEAWPGAVARGLAEPAFQALSACLCGALAFAVTWFSRKAGEARERTLRWDGAEWLLVEGGHRPAEQRGAVALMLDLGPWMLLRFVPHAGAGRRAATWLPLSLARDPARWASLRGAVWNGHGRA